MRIMVTGGAGFLGSNMCASLLERGDSVFCVDNLSTGSVDNIAELFGKYKFHFIPANVVHLPEFEIGIDQIYNFASPAAPGDYKKDPAGTLEANIAGTENLLKLATKQRARMVHASTIRVLEDAEPGSPHVAYVEGKRRAEELCLKYHEEQGTDIAIARLFNVYGPKMSRTDSRVVPQFVMRALRGEPIFIVGDGSQSDSFCYVDDVIDGLMRYMASGISPGPVVFGYPKVISILSLAEKVRAVIDSDSPIILNGTGRSAAELKAKLTRPVPDITEANARLGWQPRIPLEVGLVRLADYYAEYC